MRIYDKRYYKFIVLSLFCLSSNLALTQSLFKTYPEQSSIWLTINLNETDDGYLLDLKDFSISSALNSLSSLELSSDGALQAQSSIPLPISNSASPSTTRLSDQTIIVSWTDGGELIYTSGAKSAYINQIDNSGNLLHELEIPLPENIASASIPAITELEDGTIFIFNTYLTPNINGGPDERFFIYTHYDLENEEIVNQTELSYGNTLFSTISSIDLSTSSDGHVFLKFWDEVINQHSIRKIQPDGVQLWSTNVSSLERPVSLVTPSTDGGVFYYIDAFGVCSKLNADGEFVGTFSKYDFQTNSNNGVDVEGLIATEDGGVIAFGPTSGSIDSEDFFTARIAPSVSILSTERYAFPEDFSDSAISFQKGIRKQNGSFALSGYFGSSGQDKIPFLLSLNEDGNYEYTGFEETFYQGYSDYDASFEINKIEVTQNGYDLGLKGFTRFTTAQTDPLGNIINQESVIEIPQFLVGSPNFFTLQTSVQLSNGDLLASHTRSPNSPDFAIFIIHYDSEGNEVNQFEFDLPTNTGSTSGVEFEELEDGSVFMMGSYNLENSNFTRNITSATYNPSTQDFTQMNEFLWGDGSTSFAVRRIELAPDENFFVHFYQSSNINAHYVSKVSGDGLELWRIQVATLERPVDDLVPTTDGGVWVMNGYFNTVKRYDTDGNLVTSLPMFDVQDQVQGFFEVKGITLTPNNGIAMNAITNANGVTQLGTAVFDEDGAIIQVNLYEEYQALEFSEGFSTPDGGYAFGGYVEEIINGFLYFRPRFIKTNSLGEIIPINNGGPDLSLSISGTDETPDIWSNHSVTLTLTNEGDENTTGIAVSIPQAAGEVYSGSNEFSVSQGNFSPYGNQIWEVGDLSVGSSASITINYFKIQDNPFFQYAQVSLMNEDDIDSTPGNGNGTSINEDDEVTYPNDDPVDPCNPDVTPPVIANCPQDITVTTTDTQVQVFWDEPTVTDNCELPSLISDRNSGDVFAEGINTVNYYSNDGVGNQAVCSFTVTVITESLPPTGTCDDNLLENPGFETGFDQDDWKTLGSGGQISNDAYSGNQAMTVATNGPSGRIYQGAFDGIPGETYTLTAFAKTTDPSAYSDIYIKFMSASFQPIDTPKEKISSTEYQQYSISAMAPSNTAYIEVGIRKSSGSFAILADEFCLQAGEGIQPPVEVGCYFEEIYESVPSNVSNRGVIATENTDGSILLRLFNQFPSSGLTLDDVNVDANGNFESYTPLGILPYPTLVVDDGYLIALGGSDNTVDVSRFQFGNGTIWDMTYTITEASSILIGGGGVTTDGYVFTGTITQGGIPDVYYPILIKLDLDGNLLNYQIEEALPSQAFVDFSAEGADGYFLRIYGASAVSTTVVKTDFSGNWLWSTAFPNGYTSILTRISEGSDGSVYVSIIGGAPNDPSAPITEAEFYKLDNTGNLVWTANFGFPQGSVEQPAIEAVDGGAVLSYITKVNGGSTFNYKKLDNSNNLAWSKTYGAIKASIQFQAQDGSLLFAGTDEIGMGQGSFQARPYLLKTTSEGNLIPLCEDDPVTGPDLTLSNLDGPANATVGETIEYLFTLQNIGDESAAGDFNIKAYFSEDDVLDASDLFDGLVPTGNIAAGQTINNVLGASVVPNLPNGTYYLILQVDADNDIAESNETNNIITQMITIEPIDPPDEDCEIASDFPWHEWLSKVTLSLQVEWESGKSPYSDFSEIAPIAEFERGTLGSFIFEITYSYFTYDAYIRYYIDFNQNGIFEDDEFGSVVKTAIPPGNNVTAIRGAAKAIPEDALLGETKARIIVSRSPIIDACTDIEFGEIEDYTVRIVDENPNPTLRTVIDGLSEVQVYPNPVNDELNVAISEELPAQSIQLFNTLGKLEKTIILDQQQGANALKLFKINTADLMNGTYFLQVNGDRFKPRTIRVMVQRTY